MNLRSFLKLSFCSLSLVLALSSCTNDVARSFQPTPAAFGKINSLTVVADSSLWLAGISDSVEFFFGAPYIILPQPEPIFDVHYIESYRLSAEPAWRELRNYLVIADLSDTNSPTTEMVINDLGSDKIRQVREDGFGTAVANNKWATGQQLIYLMGRDLEELKIGLSAAYPAVVKRIKARESDRIDATAYFDGENRSIQSEITNRTGARLRIPRDYVMAPIEDTSVVWLRKMIPEGSMNILISRVPYEDQQQLSYNGLKNVRDQIGKEYVSSSAPGTFMRINDEVLPLFTETTEVNGKYAIEGRGIWEMENGYMAGPFISYLMHDPEKRELLFVDGFIFAPNKKKRDMMEELTYVLQTTNY